MSNEKRFIAELKPFSTKLLTFLTTVEDRRIKANRSIDLLTDLS